MSDKQDKYACIPRSKSCSVLHDLSMWSHEIITHKPSSFLKRVNENGLYKRVLGSTRPVLVKVDPTHWKCYRVKQ